MDKGAHFYRCDFQVHTPRDAQWSGGDAVTDTERKAYAAAFIAGCRTKGLRGVAISDHHDMAFVPYIREAARAELDAAGKPVAEIDRIFVFPAMELTLGVPCQAILIFDADFPDDLFSLAMNALAITQVAASESRQRQAERLSHLISFVQLGEELDKHTYLRGRYIVLPNVSDGGSSTLLRSGHSAHYRDMPCVGGYLDGSSSQLGTGNINILAGRNAEYGSKKLAIFQTSDNRRRDFAQLGLHSTWVKWATPTAEALRQACLANESRISEAEPALPAVAITSINVSNSRFMGPIALEFNRQYNAIIGGRGTGKSTILEYLRWAVCDQPPMSDDSNESGGDFQAKRRMLIQKTLTAFKSVVQVGFSVNGIPHVVRRNSETPELMLKIANGEFAACSEADVRNLLPVQAYSQKQLSNVGIRIEELDRLIRTPVRQQLGDLENEFKETASQLRALHLRIQKSRDLQKEIDKDELEVNSLDQQVASIRSNLTGFSPADQQIISNQHLHEQEEEIVQGWVRDFERLQQSLREPLEVAAGGPQRLNADVSELPNAPALQLMSQSIKDVYSEVESLLQAAVDRIRKSERNDDPFQVEFLKWTGTHQSFKDKYTAAKARSSSHETQIKQLGQLESRIKILKGTLATKRSSATAVTDNMAKYRSSRERWIMLHRQRTQILGQQCSELTRLSEGQIRASLRVGIGIKSVEEKFRGLLAGSNIRGNKTEKLLEMVVSAGDPIAEWESVLSELELLANCDLADPSTGSLPEVQRLSEAGFTGADLSKICGKIRHDSWIELSVIPLSDHPLFEYRSREDQYIAFADASAGQQATALLSTLLNQDGPPLIVDQPEDDLDNQVILKVVEQIWKAKQKRQLIFSSHNANLVVNGDAELVICCDYRVAADQSGGMVKREGAIDMDTIRSEITTVMEGGQEAFKLRKAKYGF